MLYWPIRLVLALSLDTIVRKTLAIPIDNGVEAEPSVVCHPDSIQVDFKTRNPFEGHVYIKGRYTESGCRSDSAAGQRSATINVPFLKCGVQRTRSLNPRGVYVRMTVVITFHPQFLTKVDRAYATQCFYMEADKTVSQELEVSELTTAALTSQAAMPVCRYEVIEGGPDGPPVKFALIGEQVYHKWTCTTEQLDMFCMVVKNCQVQNGAGNEAQLLDDNGCAIDRFLLQNLEYTNDLTAGQEAHVFKFADQPALYFQCQITISVKEPGVNCPRPQCAANGGAGSGIAVAGTTRAAEPPPRPPPAYGQTPGSAVSGSVSSAPSAYLPGAYARRAAASALFAASPGLLISEKSNGSHNNISTLINSTIPFTSTAVNRERAGRRRQRRDDDARREAQIHELGVWDVDAQPITALEIDENLASYQTQAARFKNGFSSSIVSFQSADAIANANRRTEICLNTITFGFIFAVAIAAALAAGTAMIIVCKKRSVKY